MHQGVMGGDLLQAECCSLGTLRPCGFGKDKVWGHFCTEGATTPFSTWAGQLLSLSPTGSAEPFPPSRRPCGRSVPLKGLQAWLWDHYPIPAGQRDRTVLDSPGQPLPAALAHRGPQPTQVRGSLGGHSSTRPGWAGDRGWGICWSCPVGPIPGGASPGHCGCLGTPLAVPGHPPVSGQAWCVWERREDGALEGPCCHRGPTRRSPRPPSADPAPAARPWASGAS